MDNQAFRTLQLLEELEKNHTPSQRYLAEKLNVSLGLVNSFIKRLAKKGYFKITTIPKNRVRYILTPKGITEKTQLTYAYIQYSYKLYKEARGRLYTLFEDLSQQGVRRVVFYGVSHFTEIAFMSLQETSIQIVAIIDHGRTGEKYMGFLISAPSQLKTLSFDKLLITAEDSIDEIKAMVRKQGIPDVKVETFSNHMD